MWNKFKGLPLTVKMAIGFLTTIILLGMIAVPQLVIPVMIVFLGIGSILRIAVYFIHDV